jgi:hypothetical protein
MDQSGNSNRFMPLAAWVLKDFKGFGSQSSDCDPKSHLAIEHSDKIVWNSRPWKRRYAILPQYVPAVLLILTLKQVGTMTIVPRRSRNFITMLTSKVQDHFESGTIANLL